MNFRFIFHDLYANIKTWLRSPGTVFWTVLFPVLLILIFGAIFSGGGEDEFNIIVQDLDNTTLSEEFVETLDNTSLLNVVELETGKNVTEFMHDEDKPVALVIPKGFNDAMI